MKISLNWLRDWVDTGGDVPALAHALTMAGLEIEGIHPAGPKLSGIVVGEVKSVTKHPDAEKLPQYESDVDGLADDIKRRGLLYVGTEHGIYVSFNDGASWQSLRLNLPVTPIHGIVSEERDLVIGTHGRGFYILDDINVLRQAAGDITASALSTMMAGALGMAAAEHKLAVGYGAEAGAPYLRRALNELLESWEQHGVTEFVLITAHRHEPHQAALAALTTARARVRVVQVWDVPITDLLGVQQVPLHGGEAETSVMLHLYPELVRMERARDFDVSPADFKRYLRGAMSTPPPGSAGSLGRPTAADAVKGERIYQRLLGAIRAGVFVREEHPETDTL